jgi:phosphoglycolate phosphatase
MAIVTNKPTRFSIPAIDGLGLSRFIDRSAVYCGDTLSVMKPVPFALEELSKKFGIVTSDMVMIGDSAVDIEFGKNGGATTIGATYGFRTIEELKACEPDHLINSFDELLELLL